MMLKLCAAVIFIVWSVSINARADSGVTAIPIRNLPAFSNARVLLQALANTEGFHDENHFCVVAYKGPSDLQAEIYWSTQNKLILWVPEGSNAVFFTRDYVDLTRDVVANAADIKPSDYILPWTREEVNAVLQDCARHGNYYSIKRTFEGWIQVSRFSQFVTLQKQLQDLVNTDGHVKLNRFCVIGQQDGAYLAAYVYWPAQNKLIFWLPDPYNQYVSDALTNSPVSIDLARDLRDKEDANNIGNEMERSTALKVIEACRKFGSIYTILKSN